MKVAATVFLLGILAASPEIRYFRYERPILNQSQRSGQTCLLLDPEIFAHAADQLADLRLYRESSETPYAIRLAAPVEASEQPIVPLNKGQRDGQTVFDAELPEARYSDIELSVAAQNFIATVTVSGSRARDEKAETKLGDFTIFDLSRQKLGRSTVLHLPESDFSYLHFRIAGPVPSESITGVSVVRLPATPPKYVTVAESSHITQKGHSSVLEFTVPAHVPVDRIAFIPNAESVLFSRDVSISAAPLSLPQTTDVAESRQPVTSSGNLLRVHSVQGGHRIDEERLAIDAPVADFSKSAKWTITIENGDDAPLVLQSVRLQMLERDLCFEADGNARYTLFYSDPALTTPHYDYATLFTPENDAGRIEPAPEQENPAYQPRPDDRPFTEKHPALLWAALVAVIALLAGIALRSAKRTSQTPR